MADIALAVNQALQSDNEFREIVESNCQLLFLKAIGGRVQLTSAADGRIGIRIDYSPKQEASVSSCVFELQSHGFYETGRHAT